MFGVCFVFDNVDEIFFDFNVYIFLYVVFWHNFSIRLAPPKSCLEENRKVLDVNT